MQVVAYLVFEGNAEEALQLYHRTFGGEASIMRFGEMPEGGGPPLSDAWKNKIMHAELKLAEGQTLFISDAFEGSSVTVGDNVSVHLNVDSEEDVTRFFHALSEGATVTMPVEKQFWGAVYGSLIDRFGVSWGFDYELPQ
jgi:PhnB protein